MAKRKPLVSQHLENISREALEKYQDIIRLYVRWRVGSINFRGKVYSSPSLAGAAACKRRTCNGWTFWQYERAPGDWVALNELRK